MVQRDLYIAAYDITCARRLRRVLKLVKGYATGGQKSAYECFLTPAERNQLVGRVDAVIEHKKDRFLLIRLDPRSRVYTLGIGQEPEDPPFFYCG